MFDEDMKPVWWLPTFGFFLFIAILFGLFFHPEKRFEDPGVGRHLRTAEFILQTAHVPRSDPLTFTRPGAPWMDFEWAFEATIGELDRAGGLGLVAAFCYALYGAAVLGVYRTLLQSGLSVTVVLLYTGLAFLTLHLHFSVRPVLFTYLFLALVVEVWHRRVQPLRRDWVLLPIVFVAWANIHAGWLAALVFLSGSLVGRFLDRLSGRVTGEEAPIIPWIGLTLLCTVATSINPWGWGLHKQVILFATSYKSFALWDEYRPPDFNGPSLSAITLMIILLIVLGARVLRSAPAWRWEFFLPFFFFLYEGLKAQRHVLLLIVIASVPVARDLGALIHGVWWNRLIERSRQFQARRELNSSSLLALASIAFTTLIDILKRFQANQRLAGGDAWLALLAALGMAFLFSPTPIARHIQVGKGVTPELVGFVRDHPDRFHRALNTTGNAGPLLWNLRPDFRVSFDDRGDFYGDKTVFSFVNLEGGSEGWRKTLEEGHYDSAILDDNMQLIQLLPLVPGWKEVYRDKKSVVFWRDNPTGS